MYFISQNNRVYSYLIRMSQQLWYLLTLGCCLAFGFVWWKSWYGPLASKELKFHGEYKALVQQQDAFARIQHANKKLFDEVAGLEVSLTDYLAHVRPHQITLKKFIDKALESGLTLISYTPKETITTKWYMIHEVEAGFIGSYENIVRLLHVLSIRQDLLVVKSFSLRLEGEKLYLRCTISVSEGLV